MNETAAAVRDLLKWVFQSWWRFGLFGLLLGAGLTGCATLLILGFDRVAPELTFLIAIVAYLPAQFVLSIRGFNQTEQYDALFARFGPILFIIINGCLVGLLFGISAIASKLTRNDNT